MDEQVTLPDLQVMYVESTAGTAGAAAAFDQLESRLSSLKRRRFYGTFQRPLGPYRACVAVEGGEDAAVVGLKTWEIPGGKYSRRKLLNWQAEISRIGEAFESMAKERSCDMSRPSIEFYSSQKEVVLFLPVN